MTIAADITAFHVIGAALALWAVTLAGLGVLSHNFPPKSAEKLVIGISAILVVGAIGSAIGTSKNEPKGGEAAGAETKAGKEGSSAPQQGGTPAPSTGANSGQQSGGENAKKPPAQGAAQTLTLSADPTGQLRFDKTALQAKKGTVRLVLNNPAPVAHNISLEGAGVDKEGPTVNKGGSSQVSVKLKPGKYTYYCSVPGHRQAGMQGSLTVK